MLQIINIKKSYSDGLLRENQVLKDINLSVAAGEFVAIKGASGVGKTTLLKIIGTLLPPDEGQYLFDGQDIFAENIDLSQLRNEKIGFVFQDHYLLPQLTAYENVLLPALAFRNKSSHGQEQNAQRLMREMGVWEVKNQYPASLSGGEAQRTALCRALVMKPQLILADEPTGQLDAENAAQVVKLLSETAKNANTAVVMVTHAAEMAQFADRTFILEDGKLKVQKKF